MSLGDLKKKTYDVENVTAPLSTSKTMFSSSVSGEPVVSSESSSEVGGDRIGHLGSALSKSMIAMPASSAESLTSLIEGLTSAKTT